MSSPTLGDPTLGTQLKLQRAHHHLQQLQIEITRWLDSDNKRVWCEPDRENPPYFFLKAKADEIPANPFSLLIGDILHNLRGSLDHLVFALSVEAAYPNSLPDDIAESAQFPIIGDEDRNGATGCGPALFKKASSRIRGLKATTQAVIELLQPFQDGGNFRSHPLWQLNTLSNIDKHRFFHVACAVNLGMGFSIPPMLTQLKPFAIGPGTIETFGGAVKDETIIARIPVAVGGQNEVEMYCKPVFRIAFAEGVVKDQEIFTVLGKIYEHIGFNVLPVIVKTI